MPPKKKKNDSNGERLVETMAALHNESATFEMLLDNRLKKQSDHLNDLFSKFLRSTKVDLDEIKQSQGFLSAKFDDLAISVNELRVENESLRSRNAQLTEQVKNLDLKTHVSENEIEDLKQYIRRDMLEIQGIPVTEDENTNTIIHNVVKLVDNSMAFEQNEICISHRLPSRRGLIPPIIVKFVRRDVRDKIYKSRRSLISKTSADLGYHEQSRIFINESLTYQARQLLKSVKAFKREKNYRYVWTNNGKVLLKKDSTPSSQAISFTTLKEFERFKDGMAND